MKTKAELILELVRRIPRAEPATYGDISQRAYGHRKAGQAVGQAIAAEAAKDEEAFPWWRVCYAGLKPKNSEARRRLVSEGWAEPDATTPLP